MKLNVPTIRYWMAERGMKSDADLARATGWGKAVTSRALNGKNKGIKDVRLKELAKVLGRPEADLVQLDDVAQTKAERAILAKLKTADKERRAAVLAILGLPQSLDSAQ